jgi:hypothetical protein
VNILAKSKNVRAWLSAALSASDTLILMRPRLLIASGEEGNVSIAKTAVLNTYYNNTTATRSNNYYGRLWADASQHRPRHHDRRSSLTAADRDYVRFENTHADHRGRHRQTASSAWHNEQSADPTWAHAAARRG